MTAEKEASDGLCDDPNVLFPSAVLIEEGADNIVVKHGRTIGFLCGVSGGAVTGSHITGLQIVDPSHFGISLGPFADNQMNTIEHNVVRGSQFLGILTHGTLWELPSPLPGPAEALAPRRDVPDGLALRPLVRLDLREDRA